MARAPDAVAGRPAMFEVSLEPGAARFEAPASTPLLASAEAAGVVMPSSCRNGTCRTCLCFMAVGEVKYRIEWPGLSAEEKRDGWILPCVAYPASDLVISIPA